MYVQYVLQLLHVQCVIDTQCNEINKGSQELLACTPEAEAGAYFVGVHTSPLQHPGISRIMQTHKSELQIHFSQSQCGRKPTPKKCKVVKPEIAYWRFHRSNCIDWPQRQQRG